VVSQTIGAWLASLRDLQAITVRLDRVAALQQIYLGAVPSELSVLSRVADERAGTVVIVADTSAVAAKLRQLAPRIVTEIVKREPQRTSIRLEVQLAPSVGTARVRGPEISQTGLASLTELQQSLADSPLREALTKLLDRRRAKPPE